MNSEGWKKVQLGDILTLHYGKALVSRDRNPGFIPVYSSSGITGWHDKPLVNDKGIIIGRKGNVGSIYYSDTPFYCIDTAYYVTPDDTDVDFMFLYYLLQTLGLNGLNEDSAVPGLNRETALAQWVSIPVEKQLQTLIANQIAAFDEKIKLNRQTNATLEAIAQAIFKEWFVDFNYPGATGELVDSELGPIPKGWSVDNFGGFTTVSSGKGLKRTEFTDEGYPVLGANGKIGSTNNYLLDDEVILTGRVGTLGTLQLINKKAWISDNVLIITPVETFCYHYLYFWLKTVDFQNLNRGSTQPLITKTDLLNLLILRPDINVLIDYDRICRGLFALVEIHNNESGMLSEIRDLLLPKLMSREIEL